MKCHMDLNKNDRPLNEEVKAAHSFSEDEAI